MGEKSYPLQGLLFFSGNYTWNIYVYVVQLTVLCPGQNEQIYIVCKLITVLLLSNPVWNDCSKHLLVLKLFFSEGFLSFSTINRWCSLKLEKQYDIHLL